MHMADALLSPGVAGVMYAPRRSQPGTAYTN